MFFMSSVMLKSTEWKGVICSCACTPLLALYVAHVEVSLSLFQQFYSWDFLFSSSYSFFPCFPYFFILLPLVVLSVN